MVDHTLVLEGMHTAGGIKTGVLLRKVHPTSLATLVCFTDSDGLYHVENRIEFDSDDPFSWTHFVHHDATSFLERDHEPSDPADAVPSFAEYVLVKKLLTSGDAETTFTRLDEPTGELLPARLVHEHDEVGLYLGDRLVNRHRVVGEELLASDWGGFFSHHMDDEGELLEGLDEQVSVRARKFLDS